MTDVTHPYQVTSSEAHDLILVANLEPPIVVPLMGRTVAIGRSQANDVVLDDCYVSSYHCRVAERRGAYHVRDLGSRNGTHVNGVRVEDGVLRPGARLQIGHATLLCLERPRGTVRETGLGRLVGDSAAMQRLRTDLARFADRESPVLIEGESGTGKELAARAIHEQSRFRDGPFVSVNCGALTPELAQSELFGHERGAFTGATRQHRGAFEQAHQGSLFLDEIGELDGKVQAALLRALEGGVIRRVGSEQEIRVSTRLVAATNRDLLAATWKGSFRLDLYHRLAVLRVRMPPLRDRVDDLPALSTALLERGGAPHALSGDALELLRCHHWPGNVRELRNVLERACALTDGNVITAAELRFDGFVGTILEGEDDGALLTLVAQHDGSIAAAARTLGVPRTTLRDRLIKLKYQRGLG
jgi:DNA-binding NtrC family response regulator